MGSRGPAISRIIRAIGTRTARETVSSRQGDLFPKDEQADLFGEDAPTPEYRADPDAVRQELYAILAQARAAQTMPGTPGAPGSTARFSRR
jgi:hypothetical protein